MQLLGEAAHVVHPEAGQPVRQWVLGSRRRRLSRWMVVEEAQLHQAGVPRKTGQQGCIVCGGLQC